MIHNFISWYSTLNNDVKTLFYLGCVVSIGLASIFITPLVNHFLTIIREFKKNKTVEINNDRIYRHREDIEELLLAAIDVIDKRHDLTNNRIYDFKDIYKKNSVYLPENQVELLSSISHNLHEVMSLTTLLSTEPVGEQRNDYVKQQRDILNYLENLIPKINQFRREIA